ncbi:unnamed protein product [Zymoseptoria tritici ST99CH_1E4]|uniref:DNA-directed RNA polymerase III subunit RPC4 n=1 Tax=Zymoseptoria tritici ST99CH_1E4 TaxID=1276532 RepID=A0A2H1FZ15_ZYMTR|nr:unnamed protein product [Zymoseptoria tritici ST99CH_1E4]
MPPKAPGSKAPPTQSTEQASSGSAQSPPGNPVTPAATPTPSAASTPAPLSRQSSTPRPSSTRGKPVVNAPRAANRRSQAARLEAAQTAARAKAAEAEAVAEEKKRKDREARRFGYRGNDRSGRGGGRGGRGRGGHMGDSHRSRDEDVIASGPFSAGQVTADAKAAYARRFGSGASGSGAFSGGVTSSSGGRSGGGGGGGSGGGGGGGSGGSGIKSEPGSGGTFTMSTRGLKTEDGGYISSDDEEVDTTLPKQDIDHMQVIDLTGDDAAPRRKNALAPVRLTRVPHQERTVGLSIEDSNAASNIVPPEMPTTEKKKGKQRARDVEITGSTAMPKRPTAYSSSDDENEQPYIKPEPTGDDGQARPTTPPAQDITTIPEALQDAPSSPETKRKAKERIKAIADSMGADDSDDSDVPLPEPPRFQTQAELDEWKRHYKDLRGIRNELGRQVPKTLPPPTDANGDTAMEGAAPEDPTLVKARKQEDTRSQHVYLFQFPPVLPSLIPVSVKPDPETAVAGATDQDPMDVDASAQQRSTNTGLNVQPKLPSGHVGKLRIHKSGKATLDWGGTSLLLGMGADATFLQNVLIATVPETKPEVVKEEKDKDKAKAKEGEEPLEPAVGMGMGQVRGKFVMTPNWDEILR